MTVSQRSDPRRQRTLGVISSPLIWAAGKRCQLCRSRGHTGPPGSRHGARMDSGTVPPGPGARTPEAGLSLRRGHRFTRSRGSGAGAAGCRRKRHRLCWGPPDRRRRAARPADPHSVRAHHIAAAQPCARGHRRALCCTHAKRDSSFAPRNAKDMSHSNRLGQHVCRPSSVAMIQQRRVRRPAFAPV